MSEMSVDEARDLCTMPWHDGDGYDFDEAVDGFDRMIAEVERAAAEKALRAAAEELETAPGRGVTIVSEIRAHHATWLREFAEAYRREGKE